MHGECADARYRYYRMNEITSLAHPLLDNFSALPLTSRYEAPHKNPEMCRHTIERSISTF